MRKSLNRSTLAIFASAGLVLAACGSDSEESSEEPPAVEDEAPAEANAAAEPAEEPAEAETDADAGAATEQADDASVEVPTIVVTTNILGDVVENLVGDAAEVVTMMPVGADPHSFQASAQEIDTMMNADALIVNGANLEESLIDVIEAAESDGVPTFEAISAVETIEFGEGGHDHDDHGDDHSDEEHDHSDEEHDHSDEEKDEDHDHSDEEHDHSDEEHDHSDEEKDEDHDHSDEEHDHSDEEKDEDHDHSDEEHDHSDEEHDHSDEEHSDEEHDHSDEEKDEDHDHSDEEHDHSGGEHSDEEHDHGDEEHGDDHSDEEGGHDDHDHSGDDPHFWTDPARMAEAVDGMLGFLQETVDFADPAAVDASADDYLAELAALSDEIAEIVAAVPEENRVLVTNHQVFGYFALAFGFEQVGSVIPSGSTLDTTSGGELAELAGVVEAEGVPAVFTDNTVSDELAQTLADEVGGLLVVELFSGSLGEPGGDGGTYIDQQRTNAERITAALA